RMALATRPFLPMIRPISSCATSSSSVTTPPRAVSVTRTCEGSSTSDFAMYSTSSTICSRPFPRSAPVRQQSLQKPTADSGHMRRCPRLECKSRAAPRRRKLFRSGRLGCLFDLFGLVGFNFISFVERLANFSHIRLCVAVLIWQRFCLGQFSGFLGSFGRGAVLHVRHL